MQQYCEIATPKGVMRGFFHVPHRKEFPVLLIFHGFTGQCTGTKFSYVSLSRLLEAQGVGTLRMDFLGSGESDLTFKEMTFDDELSCARILLEELKKMPQVTDIYVLGHSMGGAIASELAKIYPEDIKKLVLWAPAFCLPDALDYLTGSVKEAPVYDHNGFEISDAFVKDMLQRDFYKNLDTYKNEKDKGKIVQVWYNPSARCVSIAETLAGRFRQHAGSVAMGAWVPSCLARNWLN